MKTVFPGLFFETFNWFFVLQIKNSFGPGVKGLDERGKKKEGGKKNWNWSGTSSGIVPMTIMVGSREFVMKIPNKNEGTEFFFLLLVTSTVSRYVCVIDVCIKFPQLCARESVFRLFQCIL